MSALPEPEPEPALAVAVAVWEREIPVAPTPEDEATIPVAEGRRAVELRPTLVAEAPFGEPAVRVERTRGVLEGFEEWKGMDDRPIDLRGVGVEAAALDCGIAEEALRDGERGDAEDDRTTEDDAATGGLE